MNTVSFCADARRPYQLEREFHQSKIGISVQLSYRESVDSSKYVSPNFAVIASPTFAFSHDSNLITMPASSVIFSIPLLYLFRSLFV